MTEIDKKGILKMFRASTGYSLSDCKHYLEETNYDMNKARDILAKKYADKYSMLANAGDIEMPEFACAVGYNDKEYSYCTIRAKSDVVTRSEKLRDSILKAFADLDKTVEDDLGGFNVASQKENFKASYDELLTFYREPIKVERLNKKTLEKGEIFACYSHNVYHKQDGENAYSVSKSSAPIVLKYEGELDEEARKIIKQLAYIISMTIIGTNKAKIFHENELDKEMLENFKQEKIAECKKSGKPEAAVEKIVAGQMKKFLNENLIIYLPLIKISDFSWLKPNQEGDVTVEEAIKQTEEHLKCKLSVSFYKVFIG